MKILKVSALVLLLAKAFLVGCAPTRPGPISVALSVTPSTAHSGDSVTARISVTNRGLEAQVSKIAYHDTVLSGDGAGQARTGGTDVQDSTVPGQSTVLLATETGEVMEVTEQTRLKISAAVYSDGGEASDEMVVTYLPNKQRAGAASAEPRAPAHSLLAAAGTSQRTNERGWTRSLSENRA